MSPDLNPIEYLWQELKIEIQQYAPKKTSGNERVY